MFCIFAFYLEMLVHLFLFPLGTVRLYEVSGQCSSEARLLQLKKADDKLADILFVTIFNIYLTLLGVHWLLACGQEVVLYFMTWLVTGCSCGRE